MTAFRVTRMTPDDLADVLALQALVYDAAILESAAFYLNRMALSGASCWVARDHARLCGYLISYPWNDDLPPALNAELAALPVPATSWFLHDCAVAPAAAGRGVARQLLRTGCDWARQQGMKQASLVSLAHACGYWQQHGFLAVPVVPGSVLHAKLADYGPGASWMHLGLGVAQP